MPSRSRQEWIRLSMRTPGILIFGMVLAPCGLILNLTSTVAQNWRMTSTELTGRPSNEFIQQGIWQVCTGSNQDSRIDCNLQDATYFAQQIIPVAQGLMVASLIVTLIGLAVAIPGVRCWKDRPNWLVAGLGGVLIFLSGVMTIIPIAWYTHIFRTIPSDTVGSQPVQVGYCIILGYIGGIFEILGGLVMFIGICRCCGGKNRGETRVEEVAGTRFRNQHRRPERRVEVPSLNRARSSASSSIPYSKDSMDDDDVSFPRAKSPPVRSVNTSNGGRPYDVDL
ncbi:claudin 23a [Pungitius pungitius]|uniref:claudin 23a n=1 Tax=Pungitius pungitius TaxID=134920 RepID=UPI002E0EC4BD